MSKLSSVCEVRKIDRKEWKWEKEKEKEQDREREREIFDKRENLNLLHNDKIGSTRVFIIHWAYLAA